MENSPTSQIPPVAPQPSSVPPPPVPQDAEPERKFVMPWALLIKASMVLTSLMFLATVFIFFLYYQAGNKADQYAVLMESSIQSGQIQNASNMAILEKQSKAQADSLFNKFQILAVITGICVIDLIALTVLAKKHPTQESL